MTILGLQRRVHESGRIRIGQKVPTKSGKQRPDKLDRFRFTSRDKAQIEAAAEKWGGKVERWDAPDGRQWQVITDAAEITVIVPPSDQAFTQAYELWSAGGCQRRCNGEWDFVGDRACMCDPDPTERECKPTTRINVMLPDLRGIGLWRLESHGYYAAVELGGVVDLIRAAAGRGVLLPGRLRLEQRQVVRAGETRNFAVPVLDIDAPLGQIAAASGVMLPNGGAQTGLGAAADAVAELDSPPMKPIPQSAPTRAVAPVSEVVQRVRQKVEDGPKRRSAAPAPTAGIAPRTAAQAKAGETPPAAPQPGRKPITESKRRKVMAALTEAGLDDDARHALVKKVTDGRTQSSKELYLDEVDAFLAAIPKPGGGVNWKAIAAEADITAGMLLVSARQIAAEMGADQPGSLDAISSNPELEARVLAEVGS